MDKLMSRKFIVGIVAFLTMILNDVFGKPISDDTMMKAIGVLGVYILGQGIADHGAQGQKRPIVVAKGEDEGPNWDDTTEVDEDPDERKELLG